MSYDLKVLADHRNELLLAEVAAWLHDMGKCADAFFEPDGMGFKATSCQESRHVNPHKAVFAPTELQAFPYWPALSPTRGQCHRLEESQHNTALWRTFQKISTQPSKLDFQITLAAGSATGRELILWGRPFLSDRFQDFHRVLGSWAILPAYLGRAHGAAHIEKEESSESTCRFVSSPFGFEYTTLSDLDRKLERILFSVPSKTGTERTMFLKIADKQFSSALGDTRRPENEVTLSDWSSIVAAFYKAALAGALLNYQPQPNGLRWRLLSIRFDGLAFFAGGHRLPDILARRKLLGDALDSVRELLEVTYPLGTEVYRDEDGSVFVVPGCDKEDCTLDLLALEDDTKTLRAHIVDQVAAVLRGEAVPKVKVDSDPWWGQDPQRRGKDEPPPVGDHLEPVSIAPNPDWVGEQWNAAGEICPVCGLRPQGPSQKAKKRNVCDVCEQRRADRSEEWATSKLHTTIWTDEVADTNGRIALLAGQFDLIHWLWLDGTFVRTLTTVDPGAAPNKSADALGKTPSFARIRRVWETTRTFWQDVIQRLQADEALVPVKGYRLAIQPADAAELDVGPFHAYELVIEGIRLSVVWDAPNRRFITADNLDYLAGSEKLDRPVDEAAQPGRQFLLEEPAGYGGANKRLGTIRVAGVARVEHPYTPAIPILAEPRTFMALVPANKALDVVRAIQARYEREMGKVRNRLPLHLGIVYAGRRTPLASLLDAGRRMLRRTDQAVQASVEAVSPVDPWPEEVRLTLKVGERTIPISVPTVMGDGSTHDVWHPYWQVAGKPTDRNRWFVGPEGEHWVHVCDLRANDQVAFTPSTFDFEYLDTSARRFEVVYNSDGWRRGQERRQRPYLLEQVADLEDTWRRISRLSTSQIQGMQALIEAKRRDWGEPSGTLNVSGTFHRLVSDALREAKVYTRELEGAALTGMLSDALEIHMTIHKDKPEKEDA